MWRKATWNFMSKRGLFKTNIYTQIIYITVLPCIRGIEQWKTMKISLSMAIIKTVQNSNFHNCAMTLWPLAMDTVFPPRTEREEVLLWDNCVSLEDGQSLKRSFIALQRVKCCGRLTCFCGCLFFFKSVECICGHKNKDVRGEVHRWRGRWVQTLEYGNKITQQSLVDFPSSSGRGWMWRLISEPGFFFFGRTTPKP